MDELIENTPAPILHVLLDNVALDQIVRGFVLMMRLQDRFVCISLVHDHHITSLFTC